jgi:hypothetical protein
VVSGEFVMNIECSISNFEEPLLVIKYRYAELISAPHVMSRPEDQLSCGIPKQVRDDGLLALAIVADTGPVAKARAV